MTEPAEILLALPGDVILCWDCGADIAVFVDGIYTGRQRPSCAINLAPDGIVSYDHEGGRLFHCARCGSGAGIQDANGEGSEADPAEDARAPRVRVRSGSWTGWRALGGE